MLTFDNTRCTVSRSEDGLTSFALLIFFCYLKVVLARAYFEPLQITRRIVVVQAPTGSEIVKVNVRLTHKTCWTISSTVPYALT